MSIGPTDVTATFRRQDLASGELSEGIVGAPITVPDVYDTQVTLDPSSYSKLLDEALEWLVPKVLAEFPKAPGPRSTGIAPRDDGVFRTMAAQSGQLIVVRDSNPASLTYRDDYDVRPKPREIKAKTEKDGPWAGLVTCAPADYASLEAHAAAVAELERDGFTVAPADEGFVVRDSEGRRFHADYDLHGMYDFLLPLASPEHLPYLLNRRFDKPMIQHPPHDRWSGRNAPGPNQGPRPPAVAYLPDGSAVHVRTVAKMHRLYDLLNVDWNAIYPDA